MRENFEKLDRVITILSKGLFSYSSYTNCYEFIDTMVCINARPSQHKDHGFLNGAWYAYQEQQKIINQLEQEKLDQTSKLDRYFMLKSF